MEDYTMKYCVSARQSKPVLAVADEIKLEYRDYKALIDYVEDYPDKDIIVVIPKDTEIDWQTLSAYDERTHIVLAMEELKISNIKLCQEYKLDFYWNYPATTWYEVTGLLDLGVSQILIGGDLIFDVKRLQERVSIPIRAAVNLAFYGYIPRRDGICGEYIRPEDLHLYEGVITTVEFKADSLNQEATLMKVYKEGVWNGNLNLLITNLNFNVDNRGIADDFGVIRSTCGRRCMRRTDGCHFCQGAFSLCRTMDKVRHEWIPGVGLPQSEDQI